VAHNHPSGVPEPSPSDYEVTQTLKKSLVLVDVELLDHLVIGDNQAVSLAERGYLLPSNAR
jgi:DNA repair protein RadC